MIGTTLAHYRITASLGKGGMGEVWRATDEKLGRDVALKVLPEEFAANPDRYARFEREAKVLASLNHPNIAHLYGLETAIPEPGAGDRESGIEEREPGASDHKPQTANLKHETSGEGRAVHFLVMELVEGEDLSDRIARGPIPIDEAIPIAVQIAEGLEAAHEQGIVHRDLKPANITLTEDGAVKVLDFGLAKAWETDSGDSSSSLSPTLTRHATVEGVILGTAAYMSPEQARGKKVDHRADVWAFGVVLWEMLTGRKLFEGETVTDVLAAVLTHRPDLSVLPATVTRRLAGLIARCLRRDPTRRLQAIGDARIELQEITESRGHSHEESDHVATSIGVASPRWVYLPWLIAAGFAFALGVSLLMPTPVPDSPVINAFIPAPGGTAFDIRTLAPGSATLSPDGSRIVYAAQGEDGVTRLWVNVLKTGDARMLDDTRGAHYPFWSPDSRRIGFFTQIDRTLKTIEADGGPAMTLCDAVFGKGGTWGPTGEIVFTPGYGTPIHVVPEDGGASRPITTIDRQIHNSHRHPRFLPDGRRFLFLARGANLGDSAVMVGSLDGAESREIMRLETQAVVVSDHLLYVREGTLMARPVDPGTLEFGGPAVPLAEGVIEEFGAAVALFSASQNGLLVFHSGQPEAPMPLTRHDRTGTLVSQLSEPAWYQHPRVSPDGSRMVVSRGESDEDDQDLWIGDLGNGLWSRFTLDSSEDIYGIWDPDGDTVVFASNRSGPHALYRKAIAGSGEEEPLWTSQDALLPTDISPDGRFVVFDQYSGGASIDIWLLEHEAGEARPFRQTPANEAEGRISADGRWLAYQSDEVGRTEIYVTPFPDGGRSWQISQTGGMYPFWKLTGGELAYVDLDGNLMAVPVTAGAESINVGRPTTLFRIHPPAAGGSDFAPSPDFGHFVVCQPGVIAAENTLRLMVNWPGRLAPQ